MFSVSLQDLTLLILQCYYCYACFNFCPEQSILVKNYTHKDGRYYHPDVTAKDIAEQKGF